MTIERAKRLAEQWASGGVCTLREGEAQEYNRLFLSMLLSKQDVVRCVECKHFRRNLENDTYCSCVGGLAEPEEHDFCSYGDLKEGADNG